MSARNAVLGLLVAGAGGLLVWAMLPSTPSAPDTGGAVPPVTPTEGSGDATEPTPGAPRAFAHPRDCRPCHESVYLEWEESMHRQAWTDPHVRELSDDFRDTSCLSCHVPQPIHSGPVGSRVFERNSRFETGVDCLSCHLLPGGGVAARRSLPDAPCRPEKVDTLGDPVSCNGCHNQHGMVEEWRDLFHRPRREAGALLETGRPETCVDCHMPARDRTGEGSSRAGRSHVFPGGHSPDMLRSGMTLDAVVKEGKVDVAVTNSGVGHKAPADSRHRSFNVWVTVTTEGGVRVHDRREIAEYRLYYRVPQRDDTNLRPGETGRSSLALPTGVRGTVRVELGYSLSPPDKEAKVYTQVHVKDLPFDTR